MSAACGDNVPYLTFNDKTYFHLFEQCDQDLPTLAADLCPCNRDTQYLYQTPREGIACVEEPYQYGITDFSQHQGNFNCNTGA